VSDPKQSGLSRNSDLVAGSMYCTSLQSWSSSDRLEISPLNASPAWLYRHEPSRRVVDVILTMLDWSAKSYRRSEAWRHGPYHTPKPHLPCGQQHHLRTGDCSARVELFGLTTRRFTVHSIASTDGGGFVTPREQRL
jgi:hypothetical protein